MRRKIRISSVWTPVIIACLAGMPSAAQVSPQVPPFSLPGVNGGVARLLHKPGAPITVVCFLGTECPLAKLYGPRLEKLAKQYASRGVQFIGVYSNSQDSLEDVENYVAEHGLTFPMGKDYRNIVADQFQAQRTPEVFVLDKDRNVVYRGRIDDQYAPGVARQAATRHELKDALDALLSGGSVSPAATEAAGCLIGRVHQPAKSSEVSFANQISRLFHKHCAECHRPGEIGPFSLLAYEEAVGWADTILEVIDDGRMPPWHADPHYGDFTNERRLSAEEIQQLQDWVAAGCPFGDPDHLPPPPTFVEGWRLARSPDAVFAMRKEAFVVPADGTVEYQYFVVDPEFEEDKWVIGAQVVPGNRRVVHHSIVFIRPPDGSEFKGVGWLAAYVPGYRASEFPAGHAIKVPAGSKLVFQQHYTPTGTEQADLTKVGIVFGDEQQITHDVHSVVGIDQEFEIPPRAASYPVQVTVRRLPRDGHLRAIMPHMHLRGKSFRLVASRDGQERILLEVPEYDFNWQHKYELRQPLPLAEIDELKFTATFDNSAANLANPNPDEFVAWGDQTWEEMAVAFVEVSQPRAPREETVEPPVNPGEFELTATARAKIRAEADRILRVFDSNGDGVVDKYETPLAFRRFEFRSIDRDGDRKLTRTEIEQAAKWRVVDP